MATIDVKSADLLGDVFRVTVVVDGATMVLRVRDDADLDRQVLALTDAAARSITKGPRTVVKPAPPDPPTQADIDRAAFVVLVKDYQAKVAAVKAGVGKTTQQDVDDAVAAVKSAYIDEYAPLIVGVF